jgi:hypothetical protein
MNKTAQNHIAIVFYINESKGSTYCIADREHSF